MIHGTSISNSRFSEHNDQRYGGTVGFNAGKFNSLTNVQYNNVDTYAVDNPGGLLYSVWKPGMEL